MVFFFEVVVVVEEQSARKALLYAPMIIGDRFNLRHRLHLKTKFEGLRLLHLLEWKACSRLIVVLEYVAYADLDSSLFLLPCRFKALDNGSDKFRRCFNCTAILRTMSGIP